jgi:hypothetical protein
MGQDLMQQGGQMLGEIKEDRESFKPTVIPKREYHKEDEKEGIELAKEYDPDGDVV